MKKIIIGLCLFIISPLTTKAIMCENSQMIAYQEQAKNITVNYEYIETNDDVVFNIRFSNVPEQFTVYDVGHHQNYFNKGNGDDFRYVDAGGIQSYIPIGSEFIIENVEKNKSYKFQIFTNDISCEYNILYTHYSNIPGYNKYYKDEICKGIEDYKLCNKWLNVNYSYDEWKNEVNKYLKSLNVEKKEDTIEVTKGLFDYIIDFYLDYYYFILPIIIIMCILIRILYNKKHDLF